MKKILLTSTMALFTLAAIPQQVIADDVKKPTTETPQTPPKAAAKKRAPLPFSEAPESKELAIKACKDKFASVLKDLGIEKFEGFQSKGDAKHRQLYKIARAHLELDAMEALPQKNGYKSSYRSCMRNLNQVERSLKKKAEAPQKDESKK